MVTRLGCSSLLNTVQTNWSLGFGAVSFAYCADFAEDDASGPVALVQSSFAYCAGITGESRTFGLGAVLFAYCVDIFDSHNEFWALLVLLSLSHLCLQTWLAIVSLIGGVEFSLIFPTCNACSWPFFS